MEPEIVTLNAGSASLSLCPAVGGAISALSYQDSSLLRPIRSADLAIGNVRAMASYPLIPYSNRIKNGVFKFVRQDYVLARNFGDHPHAIHGNAWQSVWRYGKEREDRALLSLHHNPHTEQERAAWPFAYEAQQRFQLSETSLSIHLSVRNTDRRPMPAGVGLHPFFPKTAETHLCFSAREVWETDDTILPIRRVPISSIWDFSDERSIGALEVDNVFTQWKGRVRLTWPDQGMSLTMTADPIFNRLVVFTTPERDSIAIEPVSHDTDAFNRMAMGDKGTGAIVLQPGETLKGSVRFTWERL
ncbi:MAG: aldose 1-epimerase [Alphaproteobacteria bacterium]